MKFIKEIDAAIKLGLNKFKLFIGQKLQIDASYLDRPFWIEQGEQLTVLNYLILLHQEKKKGTEKDCVEEKSPLDLTQFIDVVLSKINDKNLGEPLHQALSQRKIQLTLHFLRAGVFDVNRRDTEGRTFLSLVVQTKSMKLLRNTLKRMPNVNLITRMTDARILFQPLHQAITLDFEFGVKSLVGAGADLANPFGVMRDTPVLLAARHGKIKALEALLECSTETLNLEAEESKLSADKKAANNAIELLCSSFVRNKNNKSLIRGIAMLLCRGVNPPRNESMCQLLADNRVDLLKEIDRYMDARPDLVDPFVDRCHVIGTALHKIVYANHSWGGSLRQLFGKPNDAAFVLERLVTRKYSRPQEKNYGALSSTIAVVRPKGDEPTLKLYAEFVRRYNDAYQNQRITNPWSTMRWMIAKGACNWEMVKQYARSHPGTRTQIIYDDMFKTLPKVEMHGSAENTIEPFQYDAGLK